MTQRTAIVTGSTSGIGLGIARALAADHVDIMLNGFGEASEIKRLCEELAADCKVKVAFSDADIGKPDQVRGLVERATRELGRVDILVNNAGIQHTAPVEQFPNEQAKQLLLGEKQPSLEFATPEQMGALAAFLCSDAAAQIRGAAITVDGGWTAQ